MNRKAVAEELVAVAKGLVADMLPEGVGVVEAALPALERSLKPLLGFAPRLVRTKSGGNWVQYEDEIGASAMGVFVAVFKRAVVKAVVIMQPLSDGSYVADVDVEWESNRGGTNGMDAATAWLSPGGDKWTVQAGR